MEEVRRKIAAARREAEDKHGEKKGVVGKMGRYDVVKE
jgi:uncharacterized protein with GYD domain